MTRQIAHTATGKRSCGCGARFREERDLHRHLRARAPQPLDPLELLDVRRAKKRTRA